MESERRARPLGRALSLANTGFHRELLTFSARAGSLAGLDVSTSLGDHRRTLLGVPVAGRPVLAENSIQLCLPFG